MYTWEYIFTLCKWGCRSRVEAETGIRRPRGPSISDTHKLANKHLEADQGNVRRMYFEAMIVCEVKSMFTLKSYYHSSYAFIFRIKHFQLKVKLWVSPPLTGIGLLCPSQINVSLKRTGLCATYIRLRSTVLISGLECWRFFQRGLARVKAGGLGV